MQFVISNLIWVYKKKGNQPPISWQTFLEKLLLDKIIKSKASEIDLTYASNQSSHENKIANKNTYAGKYLP